MIFDDMMITEVQELGLSGPKGPLFRHQGIMSFIPTDRYFVGWKETKANLDVLLNAVLIDLIPVMAKLKDEKDSKFTHNNEKRSES